MTILLYSDGSCLGNPGPGGTAWKIIADGVVMHQQAEGFADSTTNNRMELQAAISALHSLMHLHSLGALTVGTVEMRLDSQYVLQGLFEWMPAWKAKGFSKVKNVDLIMALDQAAEAARQAGFVLQASWVKGHDKDAHNNSVDESAHAAASRAQAGAAAVVVAAEEVATPFAPALAASAMPSDDALAAARTLLLVARDADTTPAMFLKEMQAMKVRLGL